MTSNLLNVDIVDANNVAISLAILTVAAVGPNWETFCVDLTPLIPSGVVRIRFSVDSAAGLSFDHDIAIDDVTVFDALNLAGGGGTTPVPGRALLNINRAREANGLTIDCLLPGPYTASVLGNGPLDIHIEGAANQPFLLLAGPLTVGVATIPPLGQFDVGTFNPAPPFFPTVTILFDGTQPGLSSSLYNFGADGVWDFNLNLPGLPPGPLMAFQAVNLTGDAQIAQVTNAVDVIIL